MLKYAVPFAVASMLAMGAGVKSFAQMILSLLKIEPHLSKCGGFLRVYSGWQIGFL